MWPLKDHQLKHRDLIKLQVASVCILFVVWELVVKCACGCPTMRYDECWRPLLLADWLIGNLGSKHSIGAAACRCLWGRVGVQSPQAPSPTALDMAGAPEFKLQGP